VLEPVAAHPWDQLLARLNSTLLAAPSIRPIFPPTALPPPQGFWTPGLLVAASDLAWIAGIAMFPFFIEAVAGFGGDVERVGRYRIATRVILARIGVSVASFVTTYIAFRALPWALPGAFGGNTALFEAVQHTIDSLSVPVVGLVFMWPFACGVLGLRLLEGLRWTWRAWRREWRWILAVLVVTLALRWASPLLLAGAKASGSLHWSLRLALRSVAAMYRFWLDATVCACWALLARYFGRSGAEDPRLA
jgi:hypothetical protein